MAINALLSPAPASKASESGPVKAPNDAKEGFADVLAQTVGKTPGGEDATSGPVAPAGAPPATAPTVPEVPPTSVSPPTVPEGAATETPKQGTPPHRGPVARKDAACARPVEAPPDPPPVKASPEVGAPTQAPNAPVERPDPISEDETTQDEDPATPTIPSLVSDVPLLVVTSGLPMPSTATASPASLPIVETAVTTAPMGVPKSPTLPLTPAESLLSPEVESEGAPSPTFAISVPSSPRTSDAALSGSVASAAPTSAPSAEKAVPVVTLPQAPDLVQTPPVVQAVVAEPAGGVLAATSMPNARVAQVVADVASPKTILARPTGIPERPATTVGDAVPINASTATTGDDAPSEDAPKRDVPPEAMPQPTAAPVRSAATERPEAGTSRAEVDRHLVVRQVADRIESLVASRPKDGLVVHLEPRDLGTVTLVVKGLQSALDVQVTASDERVRQSLDSARPELAQALSPRGIELRELRVATAPSTTSMGSSAGGGSAPNPEGRARPQSSGPTFAKSPRTEPSAPRPALSRSHGRGVDLLV